MSEDLQKPPDHEGRIIELEQKVFRLREQADGFQHQIRDLQQRVKKLEQAEQTNQ
jgi:prefoldin subunit 5